MKPLVVATRSGALAITQTMAVVSRLKKIYSDIEIRIKPITSQGDSDRQTTLWELKSTGFFTSRLEDALVAGDADFAVHSFKDLPVNSRSGLTIAAVCSRDFAEDCLITTAPASSLSDLGTAAQIGTSSLRRASQLRHLRADLEILPIRGNVKRRIELLEKQRLDAIVIARAAMERLKMTERIAFCFSTEEFIPAPAQGALAVQTISSDTKTTKLISAVDDKKDRLTTSAERRILSVTGCGCHAPVGAFAEINGANIKICAFISDLQGRRFIRRKIGGSAVNAEKLAEQLGAELLESGGRQILMELENSYD